MPLFRVLIKDFACIFLFSFLSGSILFSAGPVRNKLIFLPFSNDSDLAEYPDSDIFKDIFSRSLYTFIRIYSNGNSLIYYFSGATGVSSSNIGSVSDSENARYSVYGKYRFEGEKSNPKIVVDLSVYDADAGGDIFDKTYLTKTGPTVFKDIDLMIGDVISSTKIVTNTNAISAKATAPAPAPVTNIIKRAPPKPYVYTSYHYLFLTLDYDYATALVEFYPYDHDIWGGIGVAYSMYFTNNSTYAFASPVIEAGYLILGDMRKDFRLGTGFISRFDFALTGSPPVSSQNPFQIDFGWFVSFDYYIFTLRPEIYFNLPLGNSPESISYSVALGLHF